MFIYNITIKVKTVIKEEWMLWLQTEHIPEVLATGCFQHATVLQLLEVDDSEGPTYAVQYNAESKGAYNQYMEKYSGTLRQKSYEKWGDQFIAFRSLMQVVN